MRRFLMVPILLLALLAPAAAQFPGGPSAKAPEGGPAAIGSIMAQIDDHGHVAIIQAPAEPQKGGGLIQLSAFGWLQPYVDTLVQALIVVAMGWFGKTKYGQMLDQSSRDALGTFVKNRASSLIADGAVKIQGKAVHVDSGFLVRAANESATAIPDALKRFNLSPEVVAQKIIDAIPLTQAGASIIAAAHNEDAAAPVPVAARRDMPTIFLPPSSPAA